MTTNFTADQLIELAKRKKQTWDMQKEIVSTQEALVGAMGEVAIHDDMRRRGVVYGNPAEIQEAIAEVVTSLQETAQMLLSWSYWKEELTSEGRTAEWERRTAQHAARLEAIEQTVAQLVTAADARQQEAWEALHPVAQGEQAKQTAEMYVARVLARGRMAETGLYKIAQEDPSPGRTLLLEEVVAREWFTRDEVNSMMAANPEYHQVASEVAQIKTDANSVLTTLLRFARERLESIHIASRPVQDYESLLDVRTTGVGHHAPELAEWKRGRH